MSTLCGNQGRHGKFEPGKTCCFLEEHIKTQNLGKAQDLGDLPAVAHLITIHEGLLNELLVPQRIYNSR